jgi:hypothetical protein
MKIFNKNFKRKLSYFLIILILLHTTACNYYKVNKVATDDIPSIKNIGRLHKTMIVHAGEETFILKDIKLDSINLSGQLAKISSDEFYFNENDKNQRFKKEEKEILNEVHFYLNTTNLQPPYAVIPLNEINEIKIIEPDSGRTVASYIFTSVGVLVGAFAILLVIVALTKSSCPYVYVYDGEAYIFEGETFGGAISQNLERDDYMPLPNIKNHHGKYKIRISNELKEIQYTDLAELVVVNHQSKSDVLLDQHGNPQIILNKTAASKASSEYGQNLLSTLEKKDNNVFFFNEDNSISNAVFLTFKKPLDVNEGKLIISAKNTLWFDYIFGKFLSKFGSAYQNWMEKQSAMPREERLKKISEYHFPISIYLKKNNSWQLAEEIMTVGPLAYRDFIIPIDLKDIKNDEVEVMIKTGFMFWELDAAAMDFSEGGVTKKEIIKPIFANGTDTKDWTSSLMNVDQDYMIQSTVGEITEISYKVSPSESGYKQSVFLHTRGYYTLIRDFKGLPEISELNKFKNADHFSFYSKSCYLKTLENEEGQLCFSSKSR